VSTGVVYGGSGLSKLDEKGRATIPAEIRDTIQESSGGNIVCLSRHSQLPCLIGFGKAERLQLREDIEKQWNASVTQDREFSREIAGLNASSIFETNFEASGRFVLSSMQQHFGKLTSRVFFFGATTHFMLWDPDIFLKEAPEPFAHVKEELEYWLSVQKKSGGRGK